MVARKTEVATLIQFRFFNFASGFGNLKIKYQIQYILFLKLLGHILRLLFFKSFYFILAKYIQKNPTELHENPLEQRRKDFFRKKKSLIKMLEFEETKTT